MEILRKYELPYLYSSPNILTKRMGWAGHVAHMGKWVCIQNFGSKTSSEET
jgi:hypothetical protein